jgi:Lipocalin-like domain
LVSNQELWSIILARCITMKALQKYPYLLAVALLLSNCQVTSNGGDPTPSNAPKSQLLAGTVTKSWRVVSAKLNGTETFDQARACAQDDLIEFKADKNYERNEGPTKCQTKDAQVYEKGTWELANNEAEIVLNKTERLKIVELTSSSLRYTSVSIFGETRDITLQAQSN